MDWIYSTHLDQLATLEPTAAMLGLMVWTQSGGAPYQDDAPRFPVGIGSVTDAAELLGVSRPTVKRHWASFTSAFVELDPGRFTPSITAWNDPELVGPTDSMGRPLYVRISQATVRALCSLTKHASARTAWAAVKLALKLLPRLRADAYRGRGFTVWTNDQVAAQMGMGRTTLTRAFQLLEARGLISSCGGRYRKISTAIGLLTVVPGIRRSCGKPVETVEKSITTGPRDRSYSDRSPKGVERDQIREQAPRAGARRGCPPPGVVQAFQDQLPGLSEDAALELSGHVSSELEAVEWVYQESNVLSSRTVADPVGTFLWLVREGQSRPGRPSPWSRKQLRRGYKSPQRPMTEGEREAHNARAAELVQRDEERRLEREERLRAETRRLELDRREIEDAARGASSLEELRSARDRIEDHVRLESPPREWRWSALALLKDRLLAAERVESERQRIHNREQAAQLLERLRGPHDGHTHGSTRPIH
jgi:hypothetical protein